jgi:hypothetical protein
VDTRTHDWLEGRGEKIYLIHMIDDATSRLFARFVRRDSTEENMKLLKNYVEKFGRPRAFYTDKASIFRTAEKRKRDEPGVDKDPVEMPPTQIGRALRELGITWIAAHSPQAKAYASYCTSCEPWKTFFEKTTPLGESDSLGLARWIGPSILIQPIVPIIHGMAPKQTVVPPGDHAFGVDFQSFRHFFECQ